MEGLRHRRRVEEPDFLRKLDGNRSAEISTSSHLALGAHGAKAAVPGKSSVAVWGDMCSFVKVK